jgi:MauM/NapG family ferredoxin protein
MKSLDRREFIKNLGRIGTTSVIGTLGVGVFAYTQRPRSRPIYEQMHPNVLRPPGAIGEQAFLERCIRCSRCVDACTAGAIKIAGPDEPHIARGTPFIDAFETGCVLCLECTKTCPTDALEPLEDKSEVKVGLAVVDTERCVSHNGSGVCGACHTVCPFRNFAITQGIRNQPTVHEDACVGCGLCEEACIVDGVKAIRVFSDRGPAA